MSDEVKQLLIDITTAREIRHETESVATILEVVCKYSLVTLSEARRLDLPAIWDVI